MVGPSCGTWYTVSLYLDNNTAGNALVMGGCVNPFIASEVRVFWILVGKAPIDIWIGRVGTKLNPLDLPTRYVNLPFPVMNRAQFTQLFPLLCETDEFL